MFGSSILDVAIGMAVVYLILSLVASTIQEGIAAFAQTRAANLLQGLHSLLSGDKGPDGKPLLTSLYDHGLIRGLYRDPKKDFGQANVLRPLDSLRLVVQKLLGFSLDTPVDSISNRILLPSYIPARTFALAMIDILSSAGGGTGVTLDRLRAALSAALIAQPNNKALEALSALADSAGPDIKVFRKRLEEWYDDSMDRVSGWYKKHTQNVLLVIGLVLAIAFNVSSIRVAKTLWTDKDAREAMVSMAKQYTADGNPVSAQSPQGKIDPSKLASTLGERIKAVQDVADQKLLPMGWNGSFWEGATCGTDKVWRVSLTLLGWLITALALSLGASFWFDTLNKFMVIRGTIKPDEKSQAEPSKG
jgi:hypothetical protein